VDPVRHPPEFRRRAVDLARLGEAAKEEIVTNDARLRRLQYRIAGAGVPGERTPAPWT